MRIPYTAQIPDAGTVDDATPFMLIECLEVELECEVEWEDGEPVVLVSDVYLDDRSLMESSDSLAKTIADRIQRAAEDDDAFIERAVDQDGSFSFRGLGPNDPDGRMVRVAA